MRKKSSQWDPEKGLKLPTSGQLKSVWSRIQKDATAQAALDQLERDGFKVGHLRPQDPTFHNPSWADYIAAIPLLPNRPSRSYFHRRISRVKLLPVVNALRNFPRQFDDPFSEISLILTRNTRNLMHEDLPDLANRAASFIEKFLSLDWYIRERNPRNALIAELRWNIRSRTGKPHDRELSTVIDAACRAAGRNELCLDNTTLDRIEKREKETRVKSLRRLNFHAELSRTPKGESTRTSKTKR